MKTLLLIFLTCSLYAGSVDDTLAELLNYKQDKTLLHVNYNPFKIKSKVLVDDVQNARLDEHKKTQRFIVKSIFNKKAFINTQWYKKGDKLGNVTIENITNDSVFIKEGSKVSTLKLYEFKKYLSVKEQ